jgi:hypothetical protein
MVPSGESDLKNQKPERKSQKKEHMSGEYEASEVEWEHEGSGEEAEEEFGEIAKEESEERL